MIEEKLDLMIKPVSTNTKGSDARTVVWCHPSQAKRSLSEESRNIYSVIDNVPSFI